MGSADNSGTQLPEEEAAAIRFRQMDQAAIGGAQQHEPDITAQRSRWKLVQDAGPQHRQLSVIVDKLPRWDRGGYELSIYRSR